MVPTCQTINSLLLKIIRIIVHITNLIFTIITKNNQITFLLLRSHKLPTRMLIIIGRFVKRGLRFSHHIRQFRGNKRRIFRIIGVFLHRRIDLYKLIAINLIGITSLVS